MGFDPWISEWGNPPVIALLTAIAVIGAVRSGIANLNI